jgi:hypothetical protein
MVYNESYSARIDHSGYSLCYWQDERGTEIGVLIKQRIAHLRSFQNYVLFPFFSSVKYLFIYITDYDKQNCP